MNQEPRTIDEQISLLKSRGMLFNDIAQAKKTLSQISYFRLKYFWTDLMEEDGNDFVDGTTFEKVMRRYAFDHSLRLTMFDAVGVIEVALRAKAIYYLSHMAGSGLWYLDSSNFENNDYHNEFVLDLKYEFQHSTEPFAREYVSGCPSWDSETFGGANPDAWMIIEVATFGTLSKMYKNLKSQMPARSSIANDFGLYSAREFSNWIEMISLVRNIVAHHGRLWNRSFSKKVMNIRGHRDPWLDVEMTDNQRKKPYGVIAAMTYLCNAVMPNSKIGKRFYDLIKEYEDLPLYQIGIPRNWDRNPMWASCK